MIRLPVSNQMLGILTPHEQRLGGYLLVLALFAALAEAIGIGAVFPIMRLLNDPVQTLENPLVRSVFDASGAGSAERFILWSLLGLTAVFLVKNLFLALVYLFQARFVCDVEARLGIDLLSAYLRSPYADRLAQHSADRVRIVTAEVGRATAGYLMPALTLATEGFVILGIVALLMWLQPVAAAVAIGVVGSAAFFLQRTANRALERLREQRVQANSAMYKWATESLGAIKETQALGREGFFVERYAKAAQCYATTTTAFTLIGFAPRLVVETLTVSVLLLGLAAGLAAGGAVREIVPALTLFGVAAVRIMPSATRIMSAFASLRFYAPSVSAVIEGLQATPQGTLPQLLPRSARGRLDELVLDGVTYRYPGAELPSLCGVDLCVRRGELLAIVGRSGSGKTTLGDLLLGLLGPTLGEVRLNGRPVHMLVAELRGMASLVPQHFHVLDDTVRRNVAFGRADAEIEDARVWRALELASIDVRVRALPGGLNAGVKEGGAMLSGGERQRLAIARALYDDPDIIVLDEATSALDTQTEAEIMGTLRMLASDRAVLLITHRLSNLPMCDRVVLMEEGHIVDTGCFADLSARNLQFAGLVVDSEEPTLSVVPALVRP